MAFKRSAVLSCLSPPKTIKPQGQNLVVLLHPSTSIDRTLDITESGSYKRPEQKCTGFLCYSKDWFQLSSLYELISKTVKFRVAENIKQAEGKLKKEIIPLKLQIVILGKLMGKDQLVKVNSFLIKNFRCLAKYK